MRISRRFIYLQKRFICRLLNWKKQYFCLSFHINNTFQLIHMLQLHLKMSSLFTTPKE